MSQQSHGRVIRNIISLLITQLGTWTITLVLTLTLPRYLGVQLYGIYAFVGSFTGLIAIFMNLGMGTFLTWRIARHSDEAGKLTRNALVLQVPLGILMSLLVLVSVPHIDSNLLVIHLTVIIAAATVGSTLFATCVAGLAGLQIMRTPSFIGLGCSALGTTAILVTIQLHGNLVTLATCGLGAQTVGLLLVLVYSQRKMRLFGSIELRLWPKLIAGGMPFFAWAAVLLFYGQVDITLTKILAGDTVVGWYAAANRVVSIPIFLPTIVVTAVLPALSHERVPSSPRFRQLASHSLRMVMLVGIPAAAGTVLLSSHLVSLLRFPATFDQISPLIVILGINMPVIGIDMVLGTVLIAIGRQKAWTGVGVVSAIFNPLANLWAIPFTQHMYGNGAIGASVVTLATEVIMLVGALALLPHTLFSWSDVGYVIRCLMAAALMVPAVQALAGYGTISIALAVLYGAAVYAMAAYLLRLITNEDIRGVVQTIQARLGTNGTQLDGRMVAENARRMLSNVQIAARTAAGRLQTISRPLSGAVQMMEAVSQPFTSAARQTAARMGGAISRPLGSLARSGMFTLDDDLVMTSADGADGVNGVNGAGAGAASGERTIPIWMLPRGSTAPLPGLEEVEAQREPAVVIDDGVAADAGEEGGRATLPTFPTLPTLPTLPTPPTQPRAAPSVPIERGKRIRGPNQAPEPPAPTRVPVPSGPSTPTRMGIASERRKWPPHTTPER